MQKLSQNAVGGVFEDRRLYKGNDAWRTNLQLITQAADRIRSSLGPNGAYKMVTYNRGPEKIVRVTKDAVPVLEELAIQYPSLAVLSEAAKMQREEIGDGVTSFIILASALLKKADALIAKKVHANIILDGYLEAAKRTLKKIETSSTALQRSDYEDFLTTVDCGRGILTKNLQRDLLEAAQIAMIDGKLEKKNIRTIRKQGAVTSETKLIGGITVKKAKLHRNMPDNIEQPRIAVNSGRIGLSRLEVKMPGEGPFHMKFDIQSPEQLDQCQEAERKQKDFALDRLRDLRVNVLFCQQPIDVQAKSRLLDMGVLAFESVDREDCGAIAKATKAKMVGSLADLTENDVGSAKRLTVEKTDPDEMVILEVPDFATLMLRGSSAQALDELELLIQKGLTLLKTAMENANVLPSCGAIEIRIAQDIKKFALQFSGKQQIAVESFSEALTEIPRCLAENNGVNPDDAVTQLRKLHGEGFSDYGIKANGLIEPAFREPSQVMSSFTKRAYEFVSLMLRVDEQITRKEIVKFHKKQ